MAQNLITKHEIENIVNLKLNKDSEAALKEKLSKLFSTQTVQSINFNSKEFKSSFQDIVTAFNAVFKEAGVDVIDLMPGEVEFKQLGEIALGKFMEAWKTVGAKGGMQFSFNTEQLDKVIEKLDIIAKNTQKTTKASLSKSAEEINAAIYRLGDAQKKYSAIKKAIDYKPTKKDLDNLNNLNKLKDGHNAATTWEDQYQYLIKYVKVYDKLKQSGTVEFTQDQTALYDKLSKQVDQAKAVLSNLLLTKERMDAAMTIGGGGSTVSIDSKSLAQEKTLGDIKTILQNLNKKEKDATSEQKKELNLENISDTRNAIDQLNNIRANDKLSDEDYKSIETIEKSIAAKYPKQLQDTIYKILQNSSLDGTQEQSDKLYRDLYKYELAAWSRDGHPFEINKQSISEILSVYAEVESLIASFKSVSAVGFDDLSNFRESMVAFLEDGEKFDVDSIYDNVYPYFDEATSFESEDDVKKFVKEATELIATASKIPIKDSINTSESQAIANTNEDNDQGENGFKSNLAGISESVALSDSKFKQLNETLDNFIASLTQGSNGDYSKLKLNTSNVAQLIDSLNTLTKNSGNEHGTFFNSQTGEFAEIISGVGDEIHTTYKDYVEAAKKYDTRIHSHSATVAAPSVLGEGNDLQSWIDALGTIKKQIIVTKNELLSLDFSSLTHKQLKQIKTDYEAEVLKIKDETDSTEEMNVKMRAAWDKIIKSYGDHIMTSYKVPNSLSDSLQEQNIKVSIDGASLGNLLKDIVYNVNIVGNDDNANAEDDKIISAINEVSEKAGTAIAQEDTLKNFIQSSNGGVTTPDSTDVNLPKSEDGTQQNESMRTAIFKELAKYGTFQQAKDAGRNKIEFDGQEVQFAKLVSDYFKNVLGSAFNSVEFEKLWKEAREQFYTFTPKELTKDEAVDILRDKMPENVLDGWFRKGDSAYKTKIEELALSDDDIRNAALNIMWDNYKHSSGKNIGFNEFLHSDIPMYRGKNSEKYTDGDETLAFTFDRAVAEKFGKYVLETLVKPIETLGAYQTTGESEALVYRKQLEDKAEYKQWHEDMDKKNAPQTIYSAEIVKAIEDETAALTQQNEALKENNALKHEGNNEAPTTQKSTKNDIDPTKKIDTSEEVNALENVRSKVEAIKDEVEAKTGAFAAEETEVARVAQAEIEALEPLEKKVKAIKEALASIDKHTPKDVTVDDNTTLTPPDTPLETKPEIISEDEIAKLAQLRDQVKAIASEIKSIIESVVADETNLQKSIRNIAAQIHSVINAERGQLSKLNGDVEKVTASIKGLFENIASGEANIAEGLSNINVTVNHSETQQNDSESTTTAINNLIAKLDSSTVEHKDDGSHDNKKDATETTAKKTARDTNRINRSAAKIYSTLKSIQSQSNVVSAINALGGKVSTQTTLSDILTHVKEINNKTIKGSGVGNKQKPVNDLEKKSQKLGEMQAKFKTSGNLKLKAEIDNLEKYIKAKEISLELSQQEIDNLEKRRKEAYDSELLMSDASEKEKERLLHIRELERLYRQLGVAKGRLTIGSDDNNALNQEIEAVQTQIDETKKLIDVNDTLLAQFEQIRDDSERQTIAGAVLQKKRQWQSDFEALSDKNQQLAKLEAQAEITEDPVLQERARYLREIVDAEYERLGLNDQQHAKEKEALKTSYEEIRAEETKLQLAKQAKKNIADNMKRARQEARDGKMSSTRRKGADAIGSLWKMEDFSIDELKELPDVKELQDAIIELKRTQSEINTKIRNKQELTTKDDDRIKESLANVEKYTIAIKDLVKNYEFFSGENSEDLKAKLDPGQDVKTQLVEAANAFHNCKIKLQQYDAATQQLTYEVETGANELTTYTAGIRDVDNALRTVQGTTRKTETLFEAITRKTTEVFTYFSGSSMIYKGIEELRRGIQYVREIDAALTELKKVTDETEESYERFLNTASKTADKVGATIAEVVNSTADWARIGYSLEDAASLAETTSVLFNVSEFSSIDEATSALTSTLQAFGYTADNAMRVVDVMNEVGNSFAVSSDGIATALQDSASALMTANNSYEEAVALIAAANRVVQDPNSVGSALRTISLRLRGTSVKELEDAGEDTTGVVTSKSKLRSKVKSLSGVDILTDSGAYKSTYQILLEISKVWKDISDVDQAALLEILAGKNRANTAAAILSNTKDLEAAYVSAMGADGSALKENEKYLDSIQGKIDQFTNAYQTLWNNTLDSKWVQAIVKLGTEIIKFIDKIGLLNSMLMAVGFYKLLPHILQATLQVNNLNAAVTILIPKFKSLAFGVQYANSSIIDIVVSTAQMIAQTSKSIPTLIQAGHAFGGLKGALAGAAAGFKGLWAAIPLAGKVMIVVAAIGAIIAIADNLITTTEELQEELSNLKYELEDIQSELDSVNTELETTQARMAELLALDTLSFTEEEELKRLKKTNDELQRKIDLLELEKKQKQQNAAEDFVKIMEQSVEEGTYNYGGKRGFLDKLADALDIDGKSTIMSAEEYFDYLVGEYEHAVKVESGEMKGYANQKSSSHYTNKIRELLNEWTDAADGLEYGIDPETDKWLDYVYNLQDKWAVISNGNNAKTNAINRIFNKEEFSNASDAIDVLVDKLKQNPGDATIIGQIREQCTLAKDDLNAVGISIDEAVASFTQFASTSSFDTLGKKVDELGQASKVFEQLLNNTTFEIDGSRIELQNLFDKEGKIIQTKLSQIFRDTDDQTRADITSILEGAYDDIKNGTVDINNLLSKFAFKASKQIINIQKDIFAQKNQELFPDLKDEISGIIDTFDELATAVGSVVSAMDLLDQARAEEAYSGSVSLETLQNLMAYTDDYAKLVSVDETGAIHLAANAQEILIQEKLNAIKANALLAYEEANKAYQEALAAETSVSAASVIQNMLIPVIDQVSGGLSFLGSLWTSVGEAWSDGFGGKTFNLSDAINQAQSAYSSTISNRQNTRQAESETNLAQATEALAKAEANLKIAENLTADNIKTRYDSDTASGGTSNKDDAEKQKAEDEEEKITDAWDKLLKKYENELALITNERDLIDAQIAQMEATGGQASSQYYKDLIRNSGEEKTLLEEKKKALEDYLEANKDNVDQDTWTEMNNEINETAVAIKECTTNLLEYYDALEDIDSHYFEQAMDDVSRLGEEIEFVQGLLEDEDVADENGNWTEAGITRMGLYVSEMERAAQSAEQYKQKISNIKSSWEEYQQLLSATGGDVSKISSEDLNKLYDTYGIVVTSQEEYKEKTDECTDSMRDQIEAQNAARDSIIQLHEARIDAIKEGIEKEIEAYEDYIDVVKDALDAERDLYEFKRDVQKQTKDIAALERRIASLSGSDNAADVAERRRLEAELYDAKEGLNDTYYSHAKDAQSTALDEEAQAFRESKEKYMEELDLTLDNVEQLIQASMEEVLFNADVVYNQLAGEGGIADTYGVTLSNELTEPWKKASDQAKQWKTNVGVYIGECTPFVVALSDEIKKKLGKDGAWKDAEKAAKDYADFINGADLKNNMDTSIGKLCTSIQSIIDKWKGVKTAADNAYQAQYRANNVGGKPQNSGGNGGGSGTGGTDETGGSGGGPKKMYYVEATLSGGGHKKDIKGTGKNANLNTAKEIAKTSMMSSFRSHYKKKGYDDVKIENLWRNRWSKYIDYNVSQYAKGTTGTTKDEWAITDEPWLGDELTMYATPEGRLSYMRAGSTVVPADATREILKLADIGVDGLMTPKFNSGITLMSNAINKPEINLSFEALVKAERIDKDTLPEVKRFVQQEINSLVKQMNYALKGVGSR